MRHPFDFLRSLEPRGLLVLVNVGLFAACLWIFVAVTSAMSAKNHHGTETQILLALRSPSDPSRPIGPAWAKQAWIDITALGSLSVLTMVTVLVFGYLLLLRKRRTAVFALGAILGGTVLSQMLKSFFNRDRPDVVPHLVEFSNASYPSGHSMLSAVVYLTLAAIAAQTLPKKRLRIYVLFAAVLLAFLVGISRLVVGVHYPTDVLAGWTAGTAWALLCGLGASWLSRQEKEPPPSQ